MELVDGQSLDRHITPGGASPSQILDRGVAVADALGAGARDRASSIVT